MLLGSVLISILLLIVFWLPGRRERNYAIFIAADPKTVWDAYFSHVRGCNYRPGRRLLASEILSHGPLTVRDTWQWEYLSSPVHTICIYEVYEPYHRYRLRGGVEPTQDPLMHEEGEFQSEANGTWLRNTVTDPSAPDPRGKWLIQWLARRQTTRNLKALKDICEGRQPEAWRGPFPRLESRQRNLVYLGLACLGLEAFVPDLSPLTWLLAAPMVAVLVLHWGNWVMRACAVPTFKGTPLPPNATNP